MNRLSSKRNSVHVLIWNIYLDQYDLISDDCLDGKSFSEVIRRIVDQAIEQRLEKKFKSQPRTHRQLKKIQINVTKKQYGWFTDAFPNRKKAEGLRFAIDQYYKTMEV